MIGTILPYFRGVNLTLTYVAAETGRPGALLYTSNLAICMARLSYCVLNVLENDHSSSIDALCTVYAPVNITQTLQPVTTLKTRFSLRLLLVLHCFDTVE